MNTNASPCPSRPREWAIRAAVTLGAAAFYLAAVAGAAGETVVGSGHVATEKRDVKNFHGVKAEGSGDVIITQGDTEGLVIEADDNILPLIESKVDRDGILQLGMKSHHGSISMKNPVIYRLAVRTLDRITLEGSGNITAATLSADRERIELAGSGDVRVDALRTNDLAMSLPGSGDVKLAGQATKQSVELDGSVDYEAGDLKSEDVDVQVNGSGDVVVYAEKTLKVQINGSGDVQYHGSPTVTKQINGSGEVSPARGKD